MTWRALRPLLLLRLISQESLQYLRALYAWVLTSRLPTSQAALVHAKEPRQSLVGETHHSPLRPQPLRQSLADRVRRVTEELNDAGDKADDRVSAVGFPIVDGHLIYRSKTVLPIGKSHHSFSQCFERS